MLKILRYGLILVMGFSVSCSVAPESTVTEETVNVEQPLVSPKLLKEAELEIVWENTLPIDKGETLEKLYIPFDSAQGGKVSRRIYGLSSRNFLVSLNREKGNMIFGRYIAAGSLPVVGIGLYEDELFSVAGSKLMEIDVDTGVERSSKLLEFSADCPAVRNASHFYVAGTDRRIRAFRSEDKVQVFEVAAEDDSEIVSMAADEGFVVFATDTGHCVSIAPDRPAKLWQFNTADGIARPIVKDSESLFASSKDTNIYRLNIWTGGLVWKYQMGAMLKKGPAVTEGMVYQYARGEGLSAIDKESGKLVWKLVEGVSLLAEANGRSYVITNAEMLIVMDNKKAKPLYSVNLAGVTRYVSNTADSKIYIADKQGRIACLRPIEY